MKKLLVSLHDVTPAMEYRSMKLTEIILRETGADFTLLVVPDYHGSGELGRFPEFCKWLRELNTMGVEIALHGLTHLGTEPGGISPSSLLTAGEGEFMNLKKEEACRRIEAGRQILSQALGVSPPGFTAPAWLYSRGTLEALKEQEFGWVEKRSRIEFGFSNSVACPVIVFSARSRWRRLCSRSWASVSPLVFSPFTDVRLALHVRDLPELESSLTRVLRRLKTTRKCLVNSSLASVAV